MEAFAGGGGDGIARWVGAVGGVLEGDTVGGDGFDGGVALGGGFGGGFAALGLGGEVGGVLGDGGIQGGDFRSTNAGKIVGLGFGGEGAGVGDEGVTVWVEAFADEVGVGVEVGVRVVVADRLKCAWGVAV